MFIIYSSFTLGFNSYTGHAAFVSTRMYGVKVISFLQPWWFAMKHGCCTWCMMFSLNATNCFAGSFFCVSWGGSWSLCHEPSVCVVLAIAGHDFFVDMALLLWVWLFTVFCSNNIYLLDPWWVCPLLLVTMTLPPILYDHHLLLFYTRLLLVHWAWCLREHQDVHSQGNLTLQPWWFAM